MFFLVSGAAASGKTTVSKNLPARLENLECHDGDEKKPVDEFTRCQQLEEWVQAALITSPKGETFCSPANLHWASCWPAHRPASWQVSRPVCWIAATRFASVVSENEESIPGGRPTSTCSIGRHGIACMPGIPNWEQAVITKNGPSDHAYDRWTHWTQADARWQVSVIDTTDLDIDQMLDRIADWVTAERCKAQRLTPGAMWWE